MKMIYLAAGYIFVTLNINCLFWIIVTLLWYVATHKEVVLEIPWLVFIISWGVIMFAMYNTIEKDLEEAA
jgi:hypothetical protein